MKMRNMVVVSAVATEGKGAGEGLAHHDLSRPGERCPAQQQM